MGEFVRQHDLLGIFDSGVGGLTVARQVEKHLPAVSFLYFGDTKYVPYGARPASEVVELITAICHHLVDSQAKVIVMACNTSSALALEPVRQWCPIPIIAIIESAVRAALQVTSNGRIGLIANKLTANSGAYERTLQKVCDPAIVAQRRIFPMGCPKLVPLIEAGNVSGPEAVSALEEYLQPLLAQHIDTLILGCTHYPFLRPLIEEIVGPNVQIVDPARYVIEELKALGFSEGKAAGQRRYQVSGSPEAFARVSSQLLGCRVGPVEQVTLQVANVK